VLAFALGGIGAMVAAALLTYISYRNAASELLLQRDRQATFLSAVRLRDEFAKLSEELTGLARTQDLYSGNAVRQIDALQAASSRLSVFDGGVVLLDSFGKVRIAQPPRPDIIGADWSEYELFRDVLMEPRTLFSDATNLGVDNSLVAPISVPVMGQGGEMVGVLTGMFRLGEPRASSFYASIVRLRIGGSGNTYIIDGTGRILYDSGYARIGESVPAERLDEVRSGASAHHTIDLDGNDIVLAYAPVPGTRWTLVTEEDWLAATQSVRRDAWLLLALLALAITLPTAGMALLARDRQMELETRQQDVQENRLALLMRERLMPRQVPMLGGWDLALRFRPAGSAKGDFHDFVVLPNGHLMFTLGTVTEEGVVAAQVMTTARAAFRGAAYILLPPSEALSQGNNLLCPDMLKAGSVT
jgi:hypothetical protein